MKLSDYVASFLAGKGIRHVFAITGGASVHLIDSIARNPDIEYVCPQHEQAGAMAADGYSRATGNMGVAIATSGPGATNLVTGIAGAYFDSIPVMYITGQVVRSRLKRKLGVRQIGFQETDIVGMCRTITKYAVQVDDPSRIRYELEKAYHFAKSGRPGPVLIDIPDDVQRKDIEPVLLSGFKSPMDKTKSIGGIEKCNEMLQDASRPIIILGWGVRSAKAKKEAIRFVNRLGIPFVLTWAVADLFPSNYPLNVGTFGTHGTRYANFAVQNADLVLSVGSRLDTKATGTPSASFAREAKKIMVDIDPHELYKFKHSGLEFDLLIAADARAFMDSFGSCARDMDKDISGWVDQINVWKRRYPICPNEYFEQESVNPYAFVKALSRELGGGETIVSDTGCGLVWLMQAFEFKYEQRILHDWNNTAMGWALPASIGACLGLGRKKVICMTGDGSLQMNMQELATVIGHELPIKIFLVNNHGYSMVRQTQNQWLGGRHEASSVRSGLSFPDWERVADAYGFDVTTIGKNEEVVRGIRETLYGMRPAFCNVEIGENHGVIPQVKFGRPIEDQEPLLDREEFLDNMIIEPVEED